MKKIVELFQKKDQMLSLEQKAYGREELLYLLEKETINDPLMYEIKQKLNEITTSREFSGLHNSIVDKFDLFLKYLDQPKEAWQKRILDLISLSEKRLGAESKLSILNDDYFCSKELSSWAEELSYLMGKLENKGFVIEKLLELLKKAQFVLFKKDRDELAKCLKMFMLGKKIYL